MLGISSTFVVAVVNQSSKTRFHCAVMSPVSKLRTNGAFPACLSDIPTCIPRLDLLSHLGVDIPSDGRFCRTHTGQPNTCALCNLRSGHSVLDQRSWQDGPVFLLGMQLWIQTACRTLIVHSDESETSGQ